MSRPITITSAATFIPSSYNTSLSTGIVIPNGYPATNGLNSSANTTAYAVLSGQTANVSGYSYYDFTVTGIPSEATIISVACSARARTSNSSRGRAAFQLCNGTTGKGSVTRFTSTTVTVYNLTAGTWTLSELSNIKLRITVLKTGNNNYSVRFYGATLVINYSINGTEYEVTATSEYAGATASPASQWAFGGTDAVIDFNIDDLSNIAVEDNGVDVTEYLQYVAPTPGTFSFTGAPTSYDAASSTYVSAYTGTSQDGLAPATSSTRFCVFSHETANSVSKLVYNFDCSSIPANATITNVSCVGAASCYSSGQYFNTRTLQLYCGNTAKGTAQTVTGNGGTASQHTLNGGSWTRDELDDIKIVFYVQRGTDTTTASFSFFGATLTVTYTLPTEPYYAYTITSITADHDVVIKESIIVPPEEDPDKTYYSVTISSINATTNPVRGTTRVESGTSETITITPSDPQLTLALDNGVDVTSQLVPHGGGQATSALTATAQGASYGFTASSANTGYYMSTNFNQSNSASVCRVTFTLPVRCLVTINYINYAEATYDYGIFGNIDTALGTTYTADSNAYKICSSSSDNSPSVQTLTYEIESGTHYIDIKYRKDTYTDSNYDSLQFQIANIEPLEPIISYYTYDLNNINQNHSLVFIFGNVSYYFINSSTSSNAKLYPDGQMVALQGDLYKLTIVPNNTGDTITLRDNNVDVTNTLEKKQETIEKEGQLITVVNYIYALSNVQTGHTLVVYTQASEGEWYLKSNGTWNIVTVYKKINGTWVEQGTDISVFDSGSIYVHK